MCVCVICVVCVWNQGQAQGLTSWIEEMGLFLKTEEAALGDVETLQAQIQESEVRESRKFSGNYRVSRTISVPSTVKKFWNTCIAYMEYY